MFNDFMVVVEYDFLSNSRAKFFLKKKTSLIYEFVLNQKGYLLIDYIFRHHICKISAQVASKGEVKIRFLIKFEKRTYK